MAWTCTGACVLCLAFTRCGPSPSRFKDSTRRQSSSLSRFEKDVCHGPLEQEGVQLAPFIPAQLANLCLTKSLCLCQKRGGGGRAKRDEEENGMSSSQTCPHLRGGEEHLRRLRRTSRSWWNARAHAHLLQLLKSQASINQPTCPFSPSSFYFWEATLATSGRQPSRPISVGRLKAETN